MLFKLFAHRFIGRSPLISSVFNQQQLGIRFTTFTFFSNIRQIATPGLRTFAEYSAVSEEGEGEEGEKGVDIKIEENINRNQQERWDDMITQLIAYREEYGDTLVSCEYEANPRLGTWGKKQGN